jgi:hypothetical protein
MDWIGHHGDIAHWGLGFDREAPVEVEGWGKYPESGLWNSATEFEVKATYANGVQMVIGGGVGLRFGIKWIGQDGWVFVSRDDEIETHQSGLLNERFGLNGIHLYASPGHYRNFLDCIGTRKPTIAPPETAHYSAIPGHLGQISMLLGRKVRFDSNSEQIVDDPIANDMLGSPMRSPWHL